MSSVKRKDGSKPSAAKKTKVSALDAKKIKELEEEVLSSLSAANAVVDILGVVDSAATNIKTKEAGINGVVPLACRVMSKLCSAYFFTTRRLKPSLALAVLVIPASAQS